MSPHHQLRIGALALQSVSGQPESVRKSLNPVEIAGQAMARCGLQGKVAASEMGISHSLFSRQFNPENATEHPSLKKMALLPHEFWREFALLLCEDLGLAVGGPDAERHALADLVAACSQYIRVVQR